MRFHAWLFQRVQGEQAGLWGRLWVWYESDWGRILGKEIAAVRVGLDGRNF